MDIFQVLGFFVVLFFLLLPAIRQMIVESKRKQQENKGPILEEFWPENEEEEEEEKPPPKPVYKTKTQPKQESTKRLLKKDYSFKTKIEKRDIQSKVENRHLHSDIENRQQQSKVAKNINYEWGTEEVVKKKHKSRLFEAQGSFRKMIIMHEIMKRPQ